MNFRLLFVAFTLTAGISLMSSAQNIPSERPKVGLVLSGGGAKGLAHIGVLQVLEELGIQPDYISGTSMGSIVGGLYAIGYSADELSQLNGNADWNTLLSDNIPLKNIAMDEKEEYNQYIIELPLQDRRVGLPAGVLEGQNLSRLLSELTWRTIGVEDFNSYPYSFICNGTEIINGDIIEFTSGDLARAMRASMAIPSVFSPVQIDSNKVVVDGGIIRNFPVEEVRKMGADIVIGVYTGFRENITSKDLSSLVRILTRSSALYGINDTREQEKLVDILITPDLTNYSSTDFNRNIEIEEAGAMEARGHYKELKALADSLARYGQPEKPAELQEKDSVFIERIQVNNLKSLDEELIIGILDITEGEYITKEELLTAIDRLFGTLYFERLTFRFTREGKGYRLILDTKEKSLSSIKAAVHYDNFYGAGLIVNFTNSNFLISNTKFSAVADLSEYPQARVYYYKYIGPHKNFLAASDNYYESNLIPVYLEADRIGRFNQQHFTSDLMIKYTIDLNQQLGIGALFEYSAVYPDKAMQEFYPDEFNYKRYGYHGFGISGYYRLNTLDNMFIPSQGSVTSLYLKGIFSPYPDLKYLNDTIQSRSSVNSFGKLQFDFENYRALRKKLIFNTGLSFGLSDDEILTSDYFFVGGHKNNLRRNHISFAGYDLGEFVASNFIKAKFGINYRLFNNFQFELLFNALMGSDRFEDLIQSFLSFDMKFLNLGYGGGITYNTPLGPVNLFMAGNNKDGKIRWYFNMGFTF
ncbi:MAG: patatin-like phospholipase family protein [Bacteroidales bacterium]|nr:patatin-like phospholipase family protein [Bacteroidales bacterium]